MLTFLPEDLVVKILSKLPPKSLIRFRCVSKTWDALIGNPDFFSRNLLNQSIFTPTQNPDRPLPLLLVSATDKFNAERELFSFLSYDTLECVSRIPLNLPPAPNNDCFVTIPNCNLKVVASCKGILCLYDFRTRDIYLWNPATPSAGLKALPPFSRHPEPGVIVYLLGVGFGFDPRSKDFKVVRIRKVARGPDATKRVKKEVEVYSVSDGYWRMIDVSVPFGFRGGWRTAAFDGVFFWWSLGLITVAFDFSDEVFRTTPFPHARSALYFSHKLMVLNGCIAMAVFPRASGKVNMSLEIWVLLEFGVKESWTLFINIGLPPDLERPLRFWKNGELFMENSEGQLVLYDPFTRTRKNLQIEGVKESLEVALFTQSSVAINGGVELEGGDNL
ncbi:F-box protein At3g07870-like [Corylus avellana]|uniref:F-box protein At3g07870-like n=1 Tax=Corylus avellana TaxID=13451 RepID=UPI00286D5F97|nr:F-box protein At3g07870-like [Corylus avellana]